MSEKQQHHQAPEEGGKCPECSGTLFFPPSENCACHISAPCHACTSVRLTCNACGWEEPESTERATPADPNIGERMFMPGVTELYVKNPSIDLGNGKRIFDFDYDSSSGSTMDYRGRYEGEVTAQDIIEALGDGTFGHRGPVLRGGRFTYTKITD